jgi:hypothetical protein
MFNENANTTFNNILFNCRIILDMHEQMKRLYKAAKELLNIEGQTEVAKLFNASPQTLNNWEARGISKRGLLKAQNVIGCDASWLSDGVGDMICTNISSQAMEVARAFDTLSEGQQKLVMSMIDELRVKVLQHEQPPSTAIENATTSSDYTNTATRKKQSFGSSSSE